MGYRAAPIRTSFCVGKKQLDIIINVLIIHQMRHECPNCGEKLGASDVIERDGWQLQPYFTEFDGESLALTGAEANILYMLADARGIIVEPRVLGKHFASSDDGVNSVRVLIARIRKKLGSNCPIETIHGHGYRWKLNWIQLDRGTDSPKALVR